METIGPTLRPNPPGTVPFSLHGLGHAEILDDVRRLLDNEDILDRVVFDLDDLLTHSTGAEAPGSGSGSGTSRLEERTNVSLSNSDELL